MSLAFDSAPLERDLHVLGFPQVRLTLSSGMTSLEPTPIQAQHLAGGVYSVERNRMRASQLDVPLADPAALPGSGTSYGSCNAGCEP